MSRPVWPVPRSRCHAVGAVLLAACLTLMGCSSTSSSGATGGTSGSFKLITFGEFSAGVGAQIPVPYPQIAAGAKAAVRALNAAGGVDGHQVTMEACDTKGSPNGALVCAHQAVRDRVLAVVSPLELTGSYMSVLQSARIPAIGPYAVAQTLTNPLSFPLYGGSATNLAGSVALLAERGARSVSIVANASAGLSALAPLLAPVTKHFPGLKISLDPIAATTVDLAPVVAQANHSDGIVLATNNAATAVSFLNAQRQSGTARTIASSTTQITPALLARAGSLLDGMYVASAFLPATYTSNPAVTRFVAAMNAQDKAAAKDDFSANAYAAVRLFAEVAKGAKGDKKLTTASLLAGLRSGTTFDPGLTAPVQFARSSADAPNLPRLFNPKVVILKVTRGELVPVTGTFVSAYRQQ